MSLPAPAAVLRHRGPALLVGAITAFDGDTLTCAATGDGPWEWPQLLEGAAQAAGLLAGFQSHGLSNTAVIAEYRDVVVHVRRHTGPVRFTAGLDRRLLRFWRCRLAAHAADGTLLLAGRVTLSPPRRTTT
ncbi:MAG: hypothetical protein U0807_10880 [Candidatus Binatia bacterium]